MPGVPPRPSPPGPVPRRRPGPPRPRSAGGETFDPGPQTDIMTGTKNQPGRGPGGGAAPPRKRGPDGPDLSVLPIVLRTSDVPPAPAAPRRTPQLGKDGEFFPGSA